MADHEDMLTGRLGMIDARIAQAKKAAGHLQTAAEHYDTGAGKRLAELEQHIQGKGVGQDEEAEKEYCRLLAGRHRMQQAWNLSEQDRQRFPDVAERLEKARRSKPMPGQGSFDFDAEAHPRAAVGGKEKYKGGQFVPKAHSWAPADEQKAELKHLRGRLKELAEERTANRAASDAVPYPSQAEMEKDPSLYTTWKEAVQPHAEKATAIEAEQKAIWLRAKELVQPHVPPAPVFTGGEADDYQRRGTRAAAFLHWFGDWENDPEGASKVVREMDGQPAENYNLTPVAVYHGTAYGGHEHFDPALDSGHNIFGKGFYFTEDKSVAESYTEKDASNKAAAHGATTGALDDFGQPVTYLDAEMAQQYLDAETNPNWKPAMTAAIRQATEPLPGRKDGRMGVNVAKFLAAVRDPTLPIPDYAGNLQEQGSRVQFAKNGIHHLFNKLGVRPIIPPSQVYEVYLNIRNPWDMDAPVTDAEIGEYIDYVEQLEDGRNGFQFQPDDLMEHDRWERLVKDEFGGKWPDRPNLDDLLTVKQALMDVKKMEPDPAKPGKYRRSGTPLHGIFHLAGPDVLTKGDFHYMMSDGHHWDFERQRFRQWLHERGNDGIHHTGGWNIGTHRHSVWIAFHPSQIKATSNAGTFNPEDPNIFKGLRLLLGR